MAFRKLIVIIPTRNRPDLARNALNSVLGQSDCDVQILVSDNSTVTTARADLSRYCQECGRECAQYLAPSQPLPMAKHWDWAMQQALSIHEPTHFAFLTDRMMFKPDALKPLVEIITAYPNEILTYMHDIVDDFSSPVFVRQYTWTGNLYEVPSTRLLEMIAQSVMYDSSVPRMLNCIVPRTLLETISRCFGTIFDSISPDWSFAFRALEIVDSILFHDKAALVHYAQQRSNGQSAHYGITNEAFNNFIQDLGTIPVNSAAPYPEIITVWNAIISEYCHAKGVTQSPKFPELDINTYGQVLSWGIDQIKDPERQKQMRDLLSVRGWTAPEIFAAGPSAATPIKTDEGVSGIESFSVNNLEFQNATEALAYALKHPREKAMRSDHETLIQGEKRPLPQELFGHYAPLIPPLELMHDGPIGYQEFKDNEEEFFRYYVGLCGLKPDEKMLDIGSGVGRKAFPMTDYIREPGCYEGLDVVKAGIDWCTERITKRNPCFRFQLIDVCNRHYNPGGRHQAAEYKFPFANDSFDFVVLASVFTHMLPDGVGNYLSEVARLLKQGGRCFISFLLLNDVSRELLGAGKSSIQISPGTGQYWMADPSDPEAAIGYEEDFVLSLYERSGLEITRPIQYGSWCGRQEFLSYQDLILAFKPVG